MDTPHFLLYCTDEGKFVLKLEGEKTTREFGRIADAFSAADALHCNASLVVYNSVGRIVLERVA